MNADRRARIHFTAHSKAAGYYAAVLLATLAQIARSPLDPPTLVPFITYVPFIVLSAAYGGLGPGLLTTGLSLLEVAWFAADPVGSLRVKYGHDMVGMFALAVSGMVISYLFDRMRRALHTEEARRELAALLDHTYDAAFVWIPGNAGIQWWNHAAKRLYGYS